MVFFLITRIIVSIPPASLVAYWAGWGGGLGKWYVKWNPERRQLMRLSDFAAFGASAISRSNAVDTALTQRIGSTTARKVRIQVPNHSHCHQTT